MRTKKRNKPCQHYRVVKTKKGKVRKLINRGVKRKASTSLPYVRGIIKNKVSENKFFSDSYRREQKKLEEEMRLKERDDIERRLADYKRKVAENNLAIERLNKKYFPKNPWP